MAYILLSVAIAAEIAATSLLKETDGFSRLGPTAACCAAYFVCYFCMAKALRHINLGVAYATWCGAGIVVTALVSLLYYKEKLSLPGLIGIVLILIGCVLVNIAE